MKNLITLISTKGKTSEQVTKEGWSTFQKFNRVRKQVEETMREKEEESIDKLKAEKIIRSYGETLAEATEEKYPGLVYPQSLLMYPKETVKNAILIVLVYTQDVDILKQLAVGLQMLESFIDDEEAEKQNKKMGLVWDELKTKLG